MRKRIVGITVLAAMGLIGTAFGATALVGRTSIASSVSQSVGKSDETGAVTGLNVQANVAIGSINFSSANVTISAPAGIDSMPADQAAAALSSFSSQGDTQRYVGAALRTSNPQVEFATVQANDEVGQGPQTFNAWVVDYHDTSPIVFGPPGIKRVAMPSDCQFVGIEDAATSKWVEFFQQC
jgi:hypothetical protein